MQMTAVKSMRYNGAQLDVGDNFEARDERDFRILKAIGKAVPRPVDARPQMDLVIPEPPTTGGRYRRRDLRADD